MRLYQMGFEPTRLAPTELETVSLDHSDTDTGGVSPFFKSFLDTCHLVRNTG